ncbi:MAG: toprim domain-containing protein [bacterium]
MNSIERLTKLFAEFPGIGPKQARRFVYFLITRSGGYIEELKKEIKELRDEIEMCSDCKRYFVKNGDQAVKTCVVCSDTSRDQSSLIIVGRDIDFENIEKSHSFNGKYFILGGLVPILDKNPETKIRLTELYNSIDKNGKTGVLKEIILALDANSEGEYTGELIKSHLSPLVLKYNIKISEFGRGLSTGTELEYSDVETIKNALKNRS